MKITSRAFLLIALFLSHTSAFSQVYSNRLDTAYSLNCADPQAYAFVIRKFSDILMLMTFEKAALSGAAVINEINKDMEGVTINITSSKPTFSFRYKFFPTNAKLVELVQDGKKIVENEKIVSTKQDSPVYTVCAKGTPFFSQVLEPNWSKISPNAEEINAIKKQTKIDRTLVNLTPEVKEEIDKRVAAATAAKKEADEKAAAEKARIEQEQAKKEAERQAELKKQEELRLKKEAEIAAAQREVMKKIKVSGVALGANAKLPCAPSTATFENQFGEPTMILFSCDFGEAGDHNEIIFSSDQKKVVRVKRKQFLTDSDPHASDVVSKAVEHYGTPAKFDASNWLAIFGNAFTVTYNGKNGQPTRGDNGVGLSIKGRLCEIDRKCPPRYKYVIEYELIDVDAHEQVLKEGKDRLAGQSKQKLNSMKF